MHLDIDTDKIYKMIDDKLEHHRFICSKDLLDKRDALIYGSFGLVVFAIMIKYVPMIDKDTFNRFVNLALVGLSGYAFVFLKKNLEKKERNIFLIILLLVTVYLIAPKTLELLIQKLIPSFLN